MSKKEEKNGGEVTLSDSALDEWKRTFTQSKPMYNHIKLHNRKFDPETEEKDPKFGKIMVYTAGEGDYVETELNVGDSFFPVKQRVQVKCRDFYTDENGKKKAEYWCREVEVGDDIELFNGKTGEVVFRGQYRDAKEQFNLKYSVVVYAYLDGSVYRWTLGGAQLTSWFDVMNEINGLGYPHTVKVKEVKECKNDAIFWNEITFEVGEKFDPVTFQKLNQQVQADLDAYYQKIEQDKEEAKAELVEGKKEDEDLAGLPF